MLQRLVNWPQVSVLFVTFKRVHLLRRTVETFLLHTDYAPLQLVVTDDGSPESIQTEISKLPFDLRIFSRRNHGLGANMNCGLRACTGKYTLVLQDDWECRGPGSYLKDAVRILEEKATIGLVRFYGVNPEVDASRQIGTLPNWWEIERPRIVTSQNRNIYSDTPHLRTREFSEHVGPYREDLPMEECELDYQDRFLQQSQLSAAYSTVYNNATFVHIGAAESHRTSSFRHRLDAWAVRFVRRARWNQTSTGYLLAKAAYRGTLRRLMTRRHHK